MTRAEQANLLCQEWGDAVADNETHVASCARYVYRRLEDHVETLRGRLTLTFSDGSRLAIWAGEDGTPEEDGVLSEVEA